MAKKPALGWYRVTKTFRGGQSVYGFRLTRSILGQYGDLEALMECLGDSTEGGHSAGYDITMKHEPTKPANIKGVLAFREMVSVGLMLTPTKATK